MSTSVGQKVFYYETVNLKFRGKNYRFASLEDATRMNEARNFLQREGYWPGYIIRIVQLGNSGIEEFVTDSELAQLNWRGPRIVSFDQAYLWMALGIFVILTGLTIYFRFFA